MDDWAERLQLRYVTSNLADLSPERAPPHASRPYTVIATITRGEVALDLAERSRPGIRLATGTCCVLTADLKRHARAIGDGPARSLTAGYVFELRGGFDLMHVLEPPIAIEGPVSRRIGSLLAELHAGQTDGSSAFRRRLGQQRIGYALLECLADVSQPKPDAMAMRRLIPVVEHLAESYAQPVDIPDLVSLSGFSRTHFFRAFKRWTGQTPADFVKRLRIREAAMLLIDTELPIAAIGERVGYDDPFLFSRTFKAIAGVAPTAYRTQQAGL